MAVQDALHWVADKWNWRWDALVGRVQRWARPSHPEWIRVVMERETEKGVRALKYAEMDALEVSGDKWKDFGFRSYRSVGYPGYDVCAGPLPGAQFDLILAEQVLEHVLWPYRAVRSVYAMLRPGGVFLVTTPFLVNIHLVPEDCCRWTEVGMKYLLAEGGFALDDVTTGAWGNRTAVHSRLRRIAPYIPWWHSLRNDPRYPLVVWAFARKAAQP